MYPAGPDPMMMVSRTSTFPSNPAAPSCCRPAEEEKDAPTVRVLGITHAPLASCARTVGLIGVDKRRRPTFRYGPAPAAADSKILGSSMGSTVTFFVTSSVLSEAFHSHSVSSMLGRTALPCRAQRYNVCFAQQSTTVVLCVGCSALAQVPGRDWPAKRPLLKHIGFSGTPFEIFGDLQVSFILECSLVQQYTLLLQRLPSVVQHHHSSSQLVRDIKDLNSRAPGKLVRLAEGIS